MIKGIDISHYQKNPDFKRVKAAGIQFVMLKATEGVNYIDPCFKANAAAAIAAGLPIGVYHFLRAGSSVENQVKDCLAAIKPYKITWPVAVDVEHNELLTMNRDKLTSMVLDFCARIKAAGYQPMVYSNYNWFYSAKHLDVARIKASGIPIWMAWYSNAKPENTNRSNLCDMWQYASDGKVDGITSSGLDMNVSYKDFGPEFISDTTCNMAIKHGAFYQMKVTVSGNTPPKVTTGTPDVVTILPRYVVGNDHYFYLCAVGAPKSGTGIYVNGKKQFVVNVK
ncbi:glycoside hydrolase family 25 protein [Caproiciproducens galactitolivorans]|uniref:glycoside hydrolase family 25 protein n=1 Tax=Caproiciproducens galactitolivorans TaxID=642589 RepID=UPI002409493C|nr:GH25 family lysozyme [Caproiciproducens galactitolivorans]